MNSTNYHLLSWLWRWSTDRIQFDTIKILFTRIRVTKKYQSHTIVVMKQWCNVKCSSYDIFVSCQLNVNVNVNVNVEVYSLKSLWVQQTLQFTPLLVLELSVIWFHIWGDTAHFLQLMPFTIFQFFIPPRTPIPSAEITLPVLCIMTRGIAGSQVTLCGECTYPSLLGGQRQYGMRSLPNTSTHDQQWESNPRPSDLESNTLSTGPHAPSSWGWCAIFKKK